MMKGLELIHLCRKVGVISLSRGIRTDVVFGLQARKRITDEPGIRHRRASFQDEDDAYEVESESYLDEEVDVMTIDKAYDLNKSEQARNKKRLQYLITKKKFFSARPQPLMLTCNERECIRYLHKQDPVQWNIHTLSESFPATPDTIKKIIKVKWKPTPERAKLLDSKAQKNWELLAEGKLDADPHVLEHLKKFINRREVLLEQIKNSDFYLPEVEEKPVWNNGEFSGILKKYERTLEKLVKESEAEQEPKMLKDGMEKNEKEDQSSLELLQTEISREVSRHKFPQENKDSFLFGGVTKFYSQDTTLEDLENRILKKVDKNKRVNLLEEAILESKLGVKKDKNLEHSAKAVSSSAVATGIEENIKNKRTEDNNRESFEIKSKHFKESPRPYYPLESPRVTKVIHQGKEKFNKVESEEDMFNSNYIPPDERTLSGNENEIGKLLAKIKESKLENPPEEKKEEDKKNIKEKREIDWSDPERIRRENLYYDKEVKCIENTAFWNSGRTSKEKALAEMEKTPHEGPVGVDEVKNPASTFSLSQEAYPEFIKIPKHKYQPGGTYKVKDCYYDADGEFLYRVPGMTK